MTEVGLPDEAAQLAARRTSVSRQLDLTLDERGPVQLVRQLVADLDSISTDFAQMLREADGATAQRDKR